MAKRVLLSHRLGFILLAGLALLLAACGREKDQVQPGPVAVKTDTAASLAGGLGIEVTLVGVTADGGLIDLRFRVLDAEKAQKILTEPELLPVISLDGHAAALQAPQIDLPADEFTTGTIYYVLVPNSRGLISRGDRVTVKFGEWQASDVLVQ